MNGAYFHLVINHFPIVGMILGTLLLIAGLIFKDRGVNLSATGTIAFSVLTAFMAYMSGDAAEDLAKTIPGITESLINAHEDSASIGMYMAVPAGIMAALAFYSILKNEKSARYLIIITLVLSLFASAAMGYAGKTGGAIRHTEFEKTLSGSSVLDSD